MISSGSFACRPAAAWKTAIPALTYPPSRASVHVPRFQPVTHFGNRCTGLRGTALCMNDFFPSFAVATVPNRLASAFRFSLRCAPSFTQSFFHAVSRSKPRTLTGRHRPGQPRRSQSICGPPRSCPSSAMPTETCPGPRKTRMPNLLALFSSSPGSEAISDAAWARIITRSMNR